MNLPMQLRQQVRELFELLPDVLAPAERGVFDRPGSRRRRAGQVASLARQHDWTYTTDDDTVAQEIEALIEPSVRGSRSAVPHLLTGSHRGRALLACEHIGAVGEPINGPRHLLVAIATPAALPTTELTAEGVASRMFGRITDAPVLTGDAQFDRHVRVESTDARFTRALLTPVFRERIVRDSRFYRQPVRFVGSGVLTWSDGMQVERWPGMADFLSDMLDAVPTHIWLH